MDIEKTDLKNKCSCLIINFTNAVTKKDAAEISNASYLDLSEIRGADMYCDSNTELEINRRLMKYPVEAIHFLDSGSYHYITKMFVNRIKTPFTLVMFDYHSDMQAPMIHDLTSCGCWARQVLEENDYLKQLIIIGPSDKTLREIDNYIQEKLLCISIQDIQSKEAIKKLELAKLSVPLYLSIDKDVLSASYARTNWNQGSMSIEMLEKILSRLVKHSQIIGADICGEYTEIIPFEEYKKAEQINRNTNIILYEYLMNQMKHNNII